MSVAAIHAALSRAHRRLNDFDRAESHAPLEISLAVLPKDHWRLASHDNALALVQHGRRDYAGGRRSAEEGLRIRRVA